MIEIHTRQEKSTAIISLQGTVNFEATTDLRNMIEHIATDLRPKRLVVNLAQVNLIDSSGLGLLVAAQKVFQNIDCEMRICSPSAQVRQILDRCLLTSRFRVFDDEKGALGS